jgi:glycerophosphoryl diester phosphodiesterase
VAGSCNGSTAYWFAPGSDAYRHDRKKSAYRFRGVSTGKRKAPKGYKASDFRVPTLREVLNAFPKTPINIEIKGRTKAEEVPEYVANADALAKLLKGTKRRDLIVVSFKQEAVDRFHELVPEVSETPATWTSLIDMCVDGVMTATPVKFDKILRARPAPASCTAGR